MGRQFSQIVQELIEDCRRGQTQSVDRWIAHQQQTKKYKLLQLNFLRPKSSGGALPSAGWLCEIRESATGHTLLHLSALHGHCSLVRLLLEKDSHLASAKDKKGCLALHLAAWKGHLAVVEALLQRGDLGDHQPTIVNALDNAKQSALHLATLNGHGMVVRLLLQKHCDPTLRNARLETPLDIAIRTGKANLCMLILMHCPELALRCASDCCASDPQSNGHAGPPAPSYPLHYAVRLGHVDCLLALLDGGFDVNYLEREGTALHLAVKRGYCKIANILLDKGIDPSIRDSGGMTALEWLEQNVTKMEREKWTECRCILLEAGRKEQQNDEQINGGTLERQQNIDSNWKCLMPGKNTARNVTNVEQKQTGSALLDDDMESTEDNNRGTSDLSHRPVPKVRSNLATVPFLSSTLQQSHRPIHSFALGSPSQTKSSCPYQPLPHGRHDGLCSPLPNYQNVPPSTICSYDNAPPPNLQRKWAHSCASLSPPADCPANHRRIDHLLGVPNLPTEEECLGTDAEDNDFVLQMGSPCSTLESVMVGRGKTPNRDKDGKNSGGKQQPPQGQAPLAREEESMSMLNSSGTTTANTTPERTLALIPPSGSRSPPSNFACSPNFSANSPSAATAGNTPLMERPESLLQQQQMIQSLAVPSCNSIASLAATNSGYPSSSVSFVSLPRVSQISSSSSTTAATPCSPPPPPVVNAATGQECVCPCPPPNSSKPSSSFSSTSSSFLFLSFPSAACGHSQRPQTGKSAAPQPHKQQPIRIRMAMKKGEGGEGNTGEEAAKEEEEEDKRRTPRAADYDAQWREIDDLLNVLQRDSFIQRINNNNDNILLAPVDDDALNSPSTSATLPDLPPQEKHNPLVVSWLHTEVGLERTSAAQIGQILYQNGFDRVRFMKGTLNTKLMTEMGVERGAQLHICRHLNDHWAEGECIFSADQFRFVSDWLSHLDLLDELGHFAHANLTSTQDLVAAKLTRGDLEKIGIARLGHIMRIIRSLEMANSPQQQQMKARRQGTAAGEETADGADQYSPSINQRRKHCLSSSSSPPKHLPPEKINGHCPMAAAAEAKSTGGASSSSTSSSRAASLSPIMDMPELRNKLVHGCARFSAHYLGSAEISNVEGTEDCRRAMSAAKARVGQTTEVPQILLEVSVSGVNILDANQKAISHQPIQSIQVVCQDELDLNCFAYIFQDGQRHFCHVFGVLTAMMAKEIIITLGEAFNLAYKLAIQQKDDDL